MIECSKCGTENHFDGAMFCKSCGAELSSRVAVKVADPPVHLQREAQLPARQPDTSRERVEADFVVTDVPTDEVEAGNKRGVELPSEGGFDQLLKRYESDQTNLDAGGESVEQAPASDLGIESASDYLMHQQGDAGTDRLETVTPPAESLSGGTRVETRQQSRQGAHSESSLKQTQPPEEHGISADEKNRLLSSLQKTLEEEDATIAPKAVDEGATVENPFQTDPEEPTAPQPIETTAAERTATAPQLQPVFLRGHNLMFSAKVRLVPGEAIHYGNQQYVIKPGKIERKTLVIAGVLGAVIVTLLLLLAFGGSPAAKPTLFGVVTNSETQAVLAGVSVSIAQTGASTITDEAGMFKFPGLADGRYDVRMDGSLYESQTAPTSIRNGESQIMHASLLPLLQQQASFATSFPRSPDESVVNTGPMYGALKVKCNVSDAMVLVDGKALGSASQTFKRVTPGTHSVEVKREGYEDWTQQVKVDESETTTLTVHLDEVKAEGPVEYTADDFFQQAEALFAEKKFTEAIGYYTLALAKDNSLVQAYMRRADANEQSGKAMNARADYRSAADLYLHTNQFASAVACYDKIIAMAPNASDAYQLRGWAKISSGNYESGLKDVEKALSFNKEDTQSQFEYGKALYITNNYKESEKALKKIRKFGDENPEIYGYLALAYLAQGNESEARKSYDAFSKRANSSQVARMSTESGWQRLTATAGK
jgi:Flp pilus assembly protein TadD